MAEIGNQSEKFMDFMFNALDHGVDSISDGGGPLIPFLMTQTGDKKELKRFVTENYEEGINNAEKTLKELNPQPNYAVIAFDGFIPWEGKKYEAIFVRAYDKTQDEGFEFCQRYIQKEEGDGIEPIGNSALVGKTSNVLFSSRENQSESLTKIKTKKTWWKF